ncbi:hypothetical protein CYMTET_47439 [Cymbomonas tetramitiformis]|uniref:MurL C-terminal domain-containing protein n=1 Tax=Cymbomonas tetramitiformis TaxID=36881 RepID=A0AAE0BW48_9CHLO|nr:hypothetical protein CYMTET_47439 [Cymbomonas tetramitiformis]|eukprot:gene5668-6854_t
MLDILGGEHASASQEHIARGVHYFSPLQHLWEVQIAQRFCEQPKYLPVFISCNQPEGACHVAPCQSQQHTSAPQLKDEIIESGHGDKCRLEDSRQCGRCEKCVFVYTLLSAHAPAAVKEAFNDECLFEVEELLPIFKALCGLAQKPMECVGTPEEMRLSLLLAREQRRRIGQTYLPPVFEMLHDSIDSAQELLWMFDDVGPNSLIPGSWKNSD